jgi:hypothetical protein
VSVLHQAVTSLLMLTGSILAGVTLRNAVVELRTKVAQPATLRVALLGVVCSVVAVLMATS